jgi:methylmalonyl-CoA carboxyltransferase 1.3S subunit
VKLHIVIDGKTYEVEYDSAREDSGAERVPTEPPQSLVLPTPQTPGEAAGDMDESKVCRSPVAGIVSRINVEAGQAVTAGKVMLVVEAMKMENNLAAPRTVKVKSVTVKLGDTVKVGQIVIEVE